MFSVELSLSGAGDGSPLSMASFEFTMSGTGGGSLLSMALVNRGWISSLARCPSCMLVGSLAKGSSDDMLMDGLACVLRISMVRFGNDTFEFNILLHRVVYILLNIVFP
jgi:hypothetical protein